VIDNAGSLREGRGEAADPLFSLASSSSLSIVRPQPVFQLRKMECRSHNSHSRYPQELQFSASIKKTLGVETARSDKVRL